MCVEKILLAKKKKEKTKYFIYILLNEMLFVARKKRNEIMLAEPLLARKNQIFLADF